MLKKQLAAGLIILLVVLQAVTFFHGCYGMSKNREMQQRITQLQDALAHSITELQRETITNEREVVKQLPVIIDKTNYKQLEADHRLIEELKLRVAQVESENRMLLATQGQVTLQPTADSDSVFTYHDQWADFAYHVKPRTLDYSVRDSVTTIVSRIYKHHFLWWRWGTRGYQVNIVNHNPHATVLFNRYIKVEH